MKASYSLEDFNFTLPEDQIAQYPSDGRDESRLLVLERAGGKVAHRNFFNLPEYLDEGTVLVFNNARVIHARIYFRRETGARIEVILTQKLADRDWLIVCSRMKRLSPGEKIFAEADPGVFLTVKRRVDDYLEVEANRELTDDLLVAIGELPLPPYIKRKPEEKDRERYQTVYATETGAVAAPTAGLHFTADLFSALKEKKIDLEFLTLYVSWGTFQPVRSISLDEHKMHRESYHLPEDTAERINAARRAGKKIIGVGTTSLRVLESTWRDGKNIPGPGDTDIFIYPPRRVESIDGLITNFHTPYSTLLMLVAAFSGYDLIMKTYREAVEMKYRFFSYGDAMLIL